MLEIRDLSKKYKQHTALEGVTFKIAEGEVVGLLGHNGAGKTTLIRIVTQLIEADEGTIAFMGEPLGVNHSYSVGYLPEERGLYKKMRVDEYLLYICRLRELITRDAKQQIDNWLDRLDLREWKRKEINALSKGMQQKVQFIAAVIHEPQLLILDEPFSGFDPINEQAIIREVIRLKQNGTSILLSTHRMDSVDELCDKIIFINQGKVVYAGTLEGIKAAYIQDEFEVSFRSQMQLPNAIYLGVKNGLNNYLITDLSSITPHQKSIVDIQRKQKSLKEIFIAKTQGE